MLYGLVSGDVHQIAQCAHRLGIRVLRIQRIGIELQARSQPQAQAPPARRTPAGSTPCRPRQQCVDPAAPGEADLGVLARRPAQRDRRGQEGERAQERDQHADAGDQAKLGHAAEAVGTNARKPAAVAAPATRIAPPARCAVCRSAAAGSPRS